MLLGLTAMACGPASDDFLEAARLSIHRFNLDGSGLGRVLGTLETRILEAVWNAGPLTVRELSGALAPPVHYKTILTVANRMVDKGLLAREPADDRAFRFHAVETREAFLDRVSASVVTGLVGEFGKRSLAQFVDAAGEVDAAYLDELERLVRERKGVI